MIFEEKVSPDQAAKEIQEWLDAKRVSPKKRIAYQDAIDTLTDALTYGIISIGEDRKIHHTLMFPILDSKGDPAVSTFEYKPRISVDAIQARVKNAKTGDERINATVAALTDEPVAFVTKLDTEDNTIAQSVAVFFL